VRQEQQYLSAAKLTLDYRPAVTAFGTNLMDPRRSAGAGQASLAEGNAQAASLRAV